MKLSKADLAFHYISIDYDPQNASGMRIYTVKFAFWDAFLSQISISQKHLIKIMTLIF